MLKRTFDYDRVTAYFVLHYVSRSCVSKVMGSSRVTTAVMCFASFQTTTGRSVFPREPVREMDHGFPSFQAIPGSLGAPDRAYPGTDHGFPSV